LTNDVEHLGTADVRLAGYCTPKGRLQASFLMWRNPDAVFLQLPGELRPALQKRLSMFVMRAKAKLEDATPRPPTRWCWAWAAPLPRRCCNSASAPCPPPRTARLTTPMAPWFALPTLLAHRATNG
jgi:hypothetical protein